MGESVLGLAELLQAVPAWGLVGCACYKAEGPISWNSSPLAPPF